MDNLLKVVDSSVEPWREIGSDWCEEMPQGWQPLLEIIKRALYQIKRRNPNFNFHVYQLKEKFGRLTIYYKIEGLSEEGKVGLETFINYCESISELTCIQCGATATKISDGWIAPWCSECAAKETERDFVDMKGCK